MRADSWVLYSPAKAVRFAQCIQIQGHSVFLSYLYLGCTCTGPKGTVKAYLYPSVMSVGISLVSVWSVHNFLPPPAVLLTLPPQHRSASCDFNIASILVAGVQRNHRLLSVHGSLLRKCGTGSAGIVREHHGCRLQHRPLPQWPRVLSVIPLQQPCQLVFCCANF